MAEINFYANIKDNSWEDDPNNITHGAGSGIGFYGPGLNTSVAVGTTQTTTWTTDSNGTATDGVRLNNTAMSLEGDSSTDGEVSVNGSTSITLKQLPNYLAPLNIRFTHTEPVKVQNCALRIFDRNDISNPAVGVTTYVYECRHPSNQENSDYAFSDAERNWTAFEAAIGEGNNVDMVLADSPGISGFNAANDDGVSVPEGVLIKEGATHTSDRHDWYVALSAKPESIGSKQDFGLYFTLEYV